MLPSRPILVLAGLAAVALACGGAPPAASSTTTTGAASTSTSGASVGATSTSAETSTSTSATSTSADEPPVCPEERPDRGEPCDHDLVCEYEGSFGQVYAYECRCGRWGSAYPRCDIDDPCCEAGERCNPVYHEDLNDASYDCVAAP